MSDTIKIKNYPKCDEPLCLTTARGGYTKCFKHGGFKTCDELFCKSSAISGYTKCTLHGGGIRCDEPLCKSSAIGKTPKCVNHGGGIWCDEPLCKSSAVGKTPKCVNHGGGLRCDEPFCKSSARSGYTKCKLHGGGIRCDEPLCKSSAVGKTLKCVNHGGGIRCDEPLCKSSAVGKTPKCINHGGGLRCDEPLCKSSAVGKTLKCINRGGGIRCLNCIDWIDSRGGDPKYDNYCATCFKNLFPMDSRCKHVYNMEYLIRTIINDNFDGFIHDVPIYTGNCECVHRRRIDHRKLIGNTILAIETDENSHKYYDPIDEKLRYDDLYMIHSGKWIFIRFNTTDIDETVIDDKITHLIDIINTQIYRIENELNTELVEIIKLYY